MLSVPMCVFDESSMVKFALNKCDVMDETTFTTMHVYIFGQYRGREVGMEKAPGESSRAKAQPAKYVSCDSNKKRKLCMCVRVFVKKQRKECGSHTQWGAVLHAGGGDECGGRAGIRGL